MPIEDKERPMGKNTMLTHTKKLRAERDLEQKRIQASLASKRIAADLELRRIALESKKIDNDAKKMDVDDKDKARDDKRSYVNTIFTGMAVLLALGVFGLLSFNAMQTGSMFNFSGFGFSGGVGMQTAPPPEIPAIEP